MVSALFKFIYHFIRQNIHPLPKISSKSPSQSIVIGAGIAGLTAASLLAHRGLQVTVLEQNWLPGGCASSYSRKGYIFESGATTLVGLDEGMPLRHLLDTIGIELPVRALSIPMQVHFPDKKPLTRYQDIFAWIEEAEREFGQQGQRAFWEECFRISQFVWETSIVQRAFPPSSISDLIFAARHFRPKQLGFAIKAFSSTKDLLKKHGLLENERFVKFVNEQLMITAQNSMEEVNVLFGAAALCYTNYGNYYLDGGMIKLAEALVEYIESKGGQVILQQPVTSIESKESGYTITTTFRKETKEYRADSLVAAIPINDLLKVWENPDPKVQLLEKKVMPSPQLNSAFQLSLVLKNRMPVSAIHHQVHLSRPLSQTGSDSIFLSMSHIKDEQRSPNGEVVASVTTHIPDPANTIITDKEAVQDEMIDALEQHGLLKREDIVFAHASTPGAWHKWTGRSWGFVGGYPQFMKIKPWQMLDARIDHKTAYLCGDSAYPGQGIPGACLSGIIAAEKMRLDGVGE